MYYYENYNYTGICSPNPFIPQSIVTLVLAAGQASGVGNITSVGTSAPATWNTAKCIQSTSAWATEVPLTGSTVAVPRMLCADSTGAFKETSGLLANPNPYICP